MSIGRRNPKFQYNWPVKHGTTTIGYDAFVMPGTTAETNLGVLVVGASAGADMVGRLKRQLASTTTDTVVTGVTWNLREVELCAPTFIERVQYDTADTAAVASSSGTTITITSLEDNIDTSYLYAVSGTGAGELAFLDTSASGSATSKTAMGWDSTTTVIKILRLFHQVGKLNTAADKLGTDAGAGSWTILVLQNIMKTSGREEILDPTKHDNLSGLSATGRGTQFFAEVAVRNALAATTE